ncbi:MAG: sarcosine oxidase subunit gamma [Hyphomicrobium sp.]|uniref:sarcosine oxidase subunit gamma n=1 Tax=Hyphomicrobium sp. TaxID=82 RepID=UPI003D0B581C
MAEPTLQASSAFMSWHPPRTPDLAVSARETLTMASFAPARGKKDAVHAAIQAAYGASLPHGPARVEGKSIAFMWAGPDLWLAVAERGGDRDLAAELEGVLAGIASVVDQSDGRVVVRISGARARDVLAKGVPIDLHPRAFKPGGVAITHASHIGIILWQVDDAPTYECAMFRSYADSFAHWLFESAAEYASA